MTDVSKHALNAQIPEQPPCTLDVRDLRTHYKTRAGVLKAVDGVSFKVRPGRILGLVGESGSGKSATGFSIMGLVDPPGAVVGGSVIFEGEDISAWPESRMRKLRGDRIAMIFQDPMMTLNPVLSIGTQMIETLLAHRKMSKEEAIERSVDALAQVGIPAARERLSAYPHEFSGGMRQRVAIAIALLHSPSLIIADEPTTALDVTIQAQILSEVQKLVRAKNMGVIWISHDLSVVSALADDIAVMYAGRIVEQGPVSRVLSYPAHPYTRGLISSVASNNPPGQRLKQIRGAPAQLMNLPRGCAFAPRCDYADAQCEEAPPGITHLDKQHQFRCFHPLR
ncbi:ABC transporter ATP-binding protein [Paracandidimonas soli]|uniref:Peptide/nickel transport system ATP-binding protein n=1 Tax=Paracandidimonas soli TaxID=1917182 RepID=A0A4R3V2B4_9BURK|nr:ABC transporter ATP-binding protein [Paracandidimonas soli]TCU98925.1 peptide/nickel transport system ATP-binding protein [Paracandidimonas soli]